VRATLANGSVSGLPGYGDYQPTHVSTRILDFPFAVMSISLLAVMLSQLIGFISSRTSRRKEAFRKHFEDEFTQRREEADGEKKFSLVVELAELQDMERQEEQLNQTFDLVMSFASLIVFWCIGAACFHAIEGWAAGTAFYYCKSFKTQGRANQIVL
jgi:potassium channel subfamily K